MNSKKVIVALDSDNLKKIKKLVNILKSEAYAFKIGYEFFFNFGVDGYNQVKKICPNIFLDLKMHDIPNTVEKGVKAIGKLRPLLTTVHISGGNEMMRASVKNKKYTKILGVSVLTSLDANMTKLYYNEKKIENLVKKFVNQAKKNKLDGVVCSPLEIKYVRKKVGNKFLIITPGIRIKNQHDDQKRVMTPKEAIDLGADYLVIGRPIIKASNPLKILKTINNSIN